MLKVLHISFHKGCQNDIEYLSKKLNFNLTFMEYDDNNLSKGLDKYNVTHEKALASWNKHKDYYNSFDITKLITNINSPKKTSSIIFDKLNNLPIKQVVSNDIDLKSGYICDIKSFKINIVT